MHPAAITTSAVRVVNNAFLMRSNAVDCKCLITFLMTEDVELVRDAGVREGGGAGGRSGVGGVAGDGVRWRRLIGWGRPRGEQLKGRIKRKKTPPEEEKQWR